MLAGCVTVISRLDDLLYCLFFRFNSVVFRIFLGGGLLKPILKSTCALILIECLIILSGRTIHSSGVLLASSAGALPGVSSEEESLAKHKPFLGYNETMTTTTTLQRRRNESQTVWSSLWAVDFGTKKPD